MSKVCRVDWEDKSIGVTMVLSKSCISVEFISKTCLFTARVPTGFSFKPLVSLIPINNFAPDQLIRSGSTPNFLRSSSPKLPVKRRVERAINPFFTVFGYKLRFDVQGLRHDEDMVYVGLQLLNGLLAFVICPIDAVVIGVRHRDDRSRNDLRATLLRADFVRY